MVVPQGRDATRTARGRGGSRSDSRPEGRADRARVRCGWRTAAGPDPTRTGPARSVQNRRSAPAGRTGRDAAPGSVEPSRAVVVELDRHDKWRRGHLVDGQREHLDHVVDDDVLEPTLVVDAFQLPPREVWLCLVRRRNSDRVRSTGSRSTVKVVNSSPSNSVVHRGKWPVTTRSSSWCARYRSPGIRCRSPHARHLARRAWGRPCSVRLRPESLEQRSAAGLLEVNEEPTRWSTSVVVFTSRAGAWPVRTTGRADRDATLAARDHRGRVLHHLRGLVPTVASGV